MKTRIINVGKRISNRISNSFIGKTFRFAKKVASAAFSAVSFAALAFFKTSKLIGKGVRAVGKKMVSGVRKIVNLAKKKKLGKAIVYFAPA